MRGALLWTSLALVGCRYHVYVESNPVGALVTLPDGEEIVLPDDVMLHWPLGRAREVTVSAPGYRTLELKLKRRHLLEVEFVSDVVVSPAEAFGDVPRRILVFRLVPEHGPAGTWTEDDIPE